MQVAWSRRHVMASRWQESARPHGSKNLHSTSGKSWARKADFQISSVA